MLQYDETDDRIPNSDLRFDLWQGQHGWLTISVYVNND
jgi:hypothetical protein